MSEVRRLPFLKKWEKVDNYNLLNGLPIHPFIQKPLMLASVGKNTV